MDNSGDTDWEEWERKLADERLTSLSNSELVEFLSGNPSPAADIAAFCSEVHFERFFEACISVILSDPDEENMEAATSLVSGFLGRFGSPTPPYAVINTALKVLRKHLKQAGMR